MAPVDFCFNPVKINAGKRALEHLPHELRALGANKPMVLLGPEGVKAGHDRLLLKACGDSGLTLGFIRDITAPPDRQRVRELAGIYTDRGYDALVALGRGPVMDTAKVLNIAVSGQPEDLNRFTGSERIPSRLRPWAAIPVTTGDGYEMTRYARGAFAVYDSPFLMPDLALIDPRMLAPAAPRELAETAIITLTQAVEAYGTPVFNPFIEAYAAAALALIRDHLLPAFDAAGAETHRSALANARTFAACAFSNVPKGMALLLGEAMAPVSQLSAGSITALLLPGAIRLSIRKSSWNPARLLLPLAGMEAFAATPFAEIQENTFVRLQTLLQDLFRKAGGSVRVLKDGGATQETLLNVAAEAVTGHPFWNAEDARDMVAGAWEARTI